MENGVSAPTFTFFNFPTSAPVDSDFHFLEPEPFISTILYDQYPPESCSLHHQIHRNETKNLSESPPLVYPGIQEHFAEISDTDLVQSELSSMVKERLMVALEYLKEYVEDSEILIQTWMPMKKGDQYVLTTIDQPYSLNPNCRSLTSYRNISKLFHLTTEEDSKESAGLPGRVFQGRFPEWTPDVRLFRSEECPRKKYAKMYNISGCIALPVFDHRNICLAVVEIVTTSQKISYHLEIEIVCRALEAVDLRSWQDFFPLSLKAYNEINQIAVPEISETLQSVCHTYRLPLAQTWTLHDCHFDTKIHQLPEKFDYCISTINSACYVAENDLLGFHEACSEQCLFLDQGIVGKAFATNKQWFATDITSLSKINYPLSHHARISNLGAAVAIPLQNVHTGLVQFVLELFLSRDCKEIEQQKQMWDLLPVVIQESCPSFRVAMDKEIDEENTELRVIASSGWSTSPEYVESGWTPYSFLKEEPEDEFRILTQWGNNDLDLYQKQIYSGFEQIQQHSVIQHCSRAAEKRQNKIEKTISLQVLRRYFAGSLKDAAKSIGVCPTTLKRICRQHGINRWPSRKIKKVNHSLRKLQLVVNSIHGVEGLIKIDSFYKTFPGLNSAEVPEKNHFLSLQKSDKSQSSSSSQNSDPTICLSTEAKNLNSNEQTIPEERSETPKTSDDEERSETPKTSDRNHQTWQIEAEVLKNTNGLRVKATFGEEHIRFSFLEHWSLRDLKQEIAKRFRIDDFSRIDLKYTDTENEPVLLTCDADLEECIDLLSFSKIIKISLHQQQRPSYLYN